MRLSDILTEKELPTRKWVKADAKELAKYRDDIFQLIQIAYSYIGGHVNFKTPTDVNTSKGKFFEIEDISGDDEPDVVDIAKKTKHGIKHVATGHDGTKEAKKEVITYKISQLKRRGHYIEVSGRIQEILASAGVNVVDDEETVREILAGKDIEWLGDGWYIRKLGGKPHKKMLMGIPK